MSASDRCAIELSEAIDAVPHDPPLHAEFRELDTTTDTRSPGDDITVIFDGDRIEHHPTYIRAHTAAVVDLREAR